MAEQGWLEVQVSDLVHGYRWLRRIEEPKTLADDLHQRLADREQGEVARLDDVFRIAKAESCQAQTLSGHFGESLDQPCGRCSACGGAGPWVIPETPPRSIGSATRRLIDQLSSEFPDRFTTARDRARFLCGLSSPGFVRAKLTRHASFGVCERVPFAQVLEQVAGGESP
jgi:ATP-dependent DNA helicase RecQ